MDQSFHRALAVLWASHGEPMEKNAAAQYFYQLRKPSLDREVLGHHFCKVASELHQDPWALAQSVERNLPAFRVLAKTAHAPQSRLLARYYVDWAQEIEKKALVREVGSLGSRIKSLVGRGVGSLPGTSGKVVKPRAGTQWSSSNMVSGAPTPVKSGTSKWNPSKAQVDPSKPHTWGEKALGTGVLAAGVGIPAAMMMGGGGQQPEPQYQGGYGPQYQ